jgi:PAS domain S-box-containing protein
VSAGAERLLEASPAAAEIDQLLGELGRAAETSSVYVFENSSDRDGRLLQSMRHEWMAPGLAPNIGDPTLQNLAYFPGWADVLSRGELLGGHVRDDSPEARSVLEPQGVKSCLIVPIFAGEAWWGFLGFDENRCEREWSSAEKDALRAAAGILGAAIERERAVEALLASENRYRELFENANDLVYSHDLEGRLQSVNRAFELVLGYSRQEALGKQDDDFVAPDHVGLGREMTARKLATGEPTVYELDLLSKDGRRVPVEISSRLLVDNGRPVAVQVIARDVRERRRAETELRRREAILDAVSVAAEKLLRIPASADVIDATLARLGRAADVSRAYIFEGSESADGSVLLTQTHEWAADGASPQLDNPSLQAVPCPEGWSSTLAAGATINAGRASALRAAGHQVAPDGADLRRR